MKSLRMLIAAVLTGICGVVCFAQAPKRQFQFEQFPVKVYQGPIKIPEDLHKDENGDWHDEYGKRYPPVKVGFAGEYYLPILGCGTGCRYHLLTNLRTGDGISDISMFDAPEQRPKTKDGRTYVTQLYYRPDSRLLIAEYHLDFDDPVRETCRQPYYVLEDGKLKPISKTFSFCTEGQEP